MNKRRAYALVALGCVLALFLSLFPAGAFAEEESSPAPREIAISTLEDYEQLARDCRDNAYSIGLTVLLANDIDFGGKPVMPIPSFSGRFYGSGHTIYNFQCALNGSHQGIFRYLEEDGLVMNLNVTGVILPSGSRSSVGGIVGTNRGTVNNCSFSGTVEGLVSVGGIVGENLGSVIQCKAEGSVIGKHFSGGIVGYNEGEILNCRNNAAVNTELRNEPTDLNSLDLKDILGINLVSSEDSDTVSDVGGIVGISLGTVVGCTNSNTIGYQHYGYNIGGIAGRQSGFLADCINNGVIYGRKDVGGIVGQMEPYLILDSSQSLADEISALQSSMNAAMSDMDANSAALGDSAQTVQSSSAGIGEYYLDEYASDDSDGQSASEKLSDAASSASETASDTADALGDDTINDIISGNLTDDDYATIGEVGGGLASDAGSSLSDRIEERRAEREAEARRTAELNAQYRSLATGLNTMGGTLHTTLSDLARDLKSVNAHYSNILTMFTNALTGNLQLRMLTDISDLDTDDNTDGKVLNCVNNGAVNGDTNIGGISGSMGVEAEFDLAGILSANITDTVEISTDTYFAECIIRKCINNGIVSAKKEYDGGICGLGELGVISACENYGDVVTEGEYSGGIIGRSKSIVISSYALCRVSGSEYVGGISGQGKRVVDCSSIVEMDQTNACSGAICGWVDTSDDGLYISGNTFVSDTLGGIDGINYAGIAEAVSYSTLAATEGLPERFKTLKMSFRANGIVVKEISFAYGGSIDLSEVPPVPEISGYSGFWPEFQTKDLTSSVTVDAIYLDHLTGIAAARSREDSPLPIVVVEGMFEPEAWVELTDRHDIILLNDNNHRTLEAWELTLHSSASQNEPYRVHYLSPKNISGAKLFVKSGDGFEQVEPEVDGTYLVFDAAENNCLFCLLVPVRTFPTAKILVVGALVLALAACVLALNAFRKKKTKVATAAAALPLDPDAAPVEEAREPKSFEGSETVAETEPLKEAKPAAEAETVEATEPADAVEPGEEAAALEEAETAEASP